MGTGVSGAPLPRGSGLRWFFKFKDTHLYFPQVFVLRPLPAAFFYSLLNKQTYCQATCETQGVAGVCCTKLSLSSQSGFIVLVKYGLTLFIKFYFILGGKAARCSFIHRVGNELQLNLR